MSEPVGNQASFHALGGQEYVSLTTFRRNGRPVATPVWVAPDGDTLVVQTPQDTGKVKRVRHDPRVELRSCNSIGRVRPDAPVATGRAELVTEPAEVARLVELVHRKYGLKFRWSMLLERLTTGRRKPRFGLRITSG